MTCELAVKTRCHLASCGPSLSGCAKAAKPISNLIARYFSYPFPTGTVITDALNTACIAHPYATVVAVLAVSCRSEIIPPIVTAIAVFVVNLSRRPFSSYPKPAKAVGLYHISKNANVNVSGSFLVIPGYFSGIESVERQKFRITNLPAELSSFFVVVKRSAQNLTRDFLAGKPSMWNLGFSHLTLPRSLVRSRVRVASARSGFAIMPLSRVEA